MLSLRQSWPRQALFIAAVIAITELAIGHAQAQYLVTNDDPGVSVYTVATNGALTLTQQILTGGFSNVGGFFGANRIQSLNTGGEQCIFASVGDGGQLSTAPQIVGIQVSTLKVSGSASGSPNDNGASNGIGLAVNSKYLYASFADSSTIGTFVVESGCGLAFVNDLAVAGLDGGLINGMAIHGNIMIATFTDGSIESFNISAGTPVPNGDEQYSTATRESHDATYPNSIDITSDGHFAIFGDTSSSMVVEVSDITWGRLRPTLVYKSAASISSSNVILSPDETLLYVVNTQGATVTAYLFNKATGRLTFGCTSAPIAGQSANWSYLGAAGLISQTGNGGGVYVAEFGDPSSIAMVTLQSSTTGICSLTENAQSPFADNNSRGLISIGAFPPRAF